MKNLQDGLIYHLNQMRIESMRKLGRRMWIMIEYLFTWLMMRHHSINCYLAECRGDDDMYFYERRKMYDCQGKLSRMRLNLRYGKLR